MQKKNEVPLWFDKLKITISYIFPLFTFSTKINKYFIKIG